MEQEAVRKRQVADLIQPIKFSCVVLIVIVYVVPVFIIIIIIRSEM